MSGMNRMKKGDARSTPPECRTSSDLQRARALAPCSPMQRVGSGKVAREEEVGRAHLCDLLVVEVVPCLGEGLHRVARTDDDDDEWHAEQGRVLAQHTVYRGGLERVGRKGRHDGDEATTKTCMCGSSPKSPGRWAALDMRLDRVQTMPGIPENAARTGCGRIRWSTMLQGRMHIDHCRRVHIVDV